MTEGFPQTLTECIEQFSDADYAHEFMARMRWPEGVTCPRCNSKSVREVKTRRLFVCRDCHGHNQFSVKVGSIFEDSPIKLGKWLTAIWLLLNAKNGISSHELGRSIGVTQKTAWFMLHRIRTAVQTGTFQKLNGTVESDETFIGGTAKNMHKDVKARRQIGRGGWGKSIVMGLLERGTRNTASKVRAMVIANTDKANIHAEITRHVAPGTTINTDSLLAYKWLDKAIYRHQMVDHAVEYVRGTVHTNGLENFWSLLKRTIKGTYVSVRAKHLRRYLDEQTYRFNARKGTDGERFAEVLGMLAGKRLTYYQLLTIPA